MIYEAADRVQGDHGTNGKGETPQYLCSNSSSKLIDKTKRGGGNENGVVEEHDVNVAEPLDFAERAQQVEIRDACKF